MRHPLDRAKGTVHVVDDDISVREATEDLLASSGYHVKTYMSAADFVEQGVGDAAPACLILDVMLPDINGLDLQRQLDSPTHPPIVFISGHGDVPSTVRAMKAGAIDFLAKPFAAQDLLGAVESALEVHRQALALQERHEDLQRRYAQLTRREREVMFLVSRGLLNKQAAATLNISEVTLQIHRGNVMRKMAARSLAHLVKMSIDLGVVHDLSTDELPPPVQNPAAPETYTGVDQE